MKAPKVSVLIPTYNYARFLPEAIESVLRQDFHDYEILIVDDGSTDNSAEIVAPFCRDSRIVFEVNQTNLGMVGNWNFCLQKARGEYVKYLFGDDKLSGHQALGKLAAMLDTHPSAVLATSARKIIDENSRPILSWNDWKKPGCHNGRSVILACLRSQKNLVGEPTAVMFRRTFAQRGFNPEYRQIVDLEMWVHLLEQGDMVFDPEELCCFRRHSAQQTEVNRPSQIGQKELLTLFAKCSEQPWYGESSVLTRLNLVRSVRKLRNYCSRAEFKVFDQRVRARVPKALFVIYWIAFRICRPFENLSLSLRKRFLRGKVRPKASFEKAA